MDWLGNILIVVGLWLTGNKNRAAFIFAAVGETVWVVYAVAHGLWSLAFICVVFAVLAARNWFKWAAEK